MKVVVVGTDQKDRERVAKVIKDRYSGLAEENAALLKKLERSNDAWIRGREEIADLKTAVKVFQDDTAMRKFHIEHLEGQIVALKARVKELESAMNLLGEDPSWCELLVEKCAEITKQEDQIAALKERERILIGRLRSHGDVETDREEALRGGEE